MDVTGILMGIGCFVVSSIAIYVFTKFTMQEKSWEQVKQEQMLTRDSGLFGRKTATKEKKREKPKKKKRAEEKRDTSNEDTDEAAHVTKTDKMVEYEPDPEIIEPVQDDHPKPVETPKSKKKSILKNLREETPIDATGQGALLPHSKKPMDDVALKHERERRESENLSDDAGEALKEAVVAPTQATLVSSAPPPSKKKEAKVKTAAPPVKNIGPGGDGAPSNENLILLISQAKWTDEELSKVCSLLPATVSAKKSAKNEAALTKQLADAKDAADKERLTVKSLAKQLEETIIKIKAYEGQQVNYEKEKSQLQLQMEGYRQSVESERQRTMEYQTNYTALQTQLRTVQAELEQQRASGVQSALQQQLERNAIDLNNKDSEINRLKMDNERKTRDMTGLNSQLRAMEGKQSEWRQQAEANIREKEAHIQSLQREFQKAKDQLNQTPQPDARLAQQLSSLQQELERKTDEAQKVQSTIKTLQGTNQSLKVELQSSQQQLQQAAHHAPEPLPDPRLSTLVQEVADKESEVKSLRKDLEMQRDRNNTVEGDNKGLHVKVSELKKQSEALQERMQKELQDHQSVAEKLTSDLSASDKTIVHLKKELEEKSKETTQRQDGKLTVEIEKLREEFSSEKRRYDREREDAVKKLAEKTEDLHALRQRGEEAQKSLQHDLDSLQSQLARRDETITSLEQNVVSLRQELQVKLEELSKAEHSPVDIPSTKVEELEARLVQSGEQRETLERQNTDLDGRVHHYEKVLASTESMLRALENSVESEELKWKEKMDSVSHDLSQERQRADQLAQENAALKQNTEGYSDLDFAYTCVEKSLPHIITEMECKVEDLESKLSSTSSQCEALSGQLTQSQQEVNNLKSELEEARKSSDASSEGMSNGTSASEELNELRSKMVSADREIEQLSQANKLLSAKLAASAASKVESSS